VTSGDIRYLLDLNCLIALADPDHEHHRAIHAWFQVSGKQNWGVCALTEAGFVRVTTNPAYRPATRTVAQAAAILADFATAAGYRYWPVTEPWDALTQGFAGRIFGHHQVTDACLLGLAVRCGGVLVTFDRGIRYLAGADLANHVLVLQ